MRTVLLILTMFAAPSFACSVLQPDVQVRKERKDLARQAVIVKQLVEEADFIFFGEATASDETAKTVSFAPDRIIKGTSVPTVTVVAPGLESFAISCWASDMFRNTRAEPGTQYIVYVRSGTILRAGWSTRQAGDIPFERELRIAEALSKN